MLLADGLQQLLAPVGLQRLIETFLHIGGLLVGPDALGGAVLDLHQGVSVTSAGFQPTVCTSHSRQATR